MSPDDIRLPATREEAIDRMLEVARTMEQGPQSVDGLPWPCPLRVVFGYDWRTQANRMFLGQLAPIFIPADQFRDRGAEASRERCIAGIEALRGRR